MNRSPWRLEEVDGSPWRLEEVDDGDEQYPWSPVLRYATPLPMNRTPVLTVTLQHKSVSSVLRYATPPRSTGPRFDYRRSKRSLFPPFCGTLRPLPVSRILFRP